MKMSIIRQSIPLGVICILLAGHLQAAPVYFTIDSAQSDVSLAIHPYTVPQPGQRNFGADLGAQAPDSLSAPVSGILLSETDLSTSLLIGPSLISVANTGNWLPKVNLGFGVAVSMPGNYGATLSGSGFFNDIYFALRGTTFSVLGGPVAIANDGSFDAASLLWNVDTVVSEAAFDLIGGAKVPVAQTATNALASGTLEQQGNLAKLILPIDVTYDLPGAFLNFGGGPLGVTLQFTGSIVATAAVPEPSAGSIVASGVATLLGWVVVQCKRAPVRDSGYLKPKSTFQPASARKRQLHFAMNQEGGPGSTACASWERPVQQVFATWSPANRHFRDYSVTDGTARFEQA